MAVILLGSEATGALLSGLGRVTLVNRTAPESDVIIAAAAIVRHHDGQEALTDAVYGLEIAADESVDIEATPPMTAAPDAVEVLLRLRIGDGAVADAYAVTERAAEDLGGRTQFGIRENDGELSEGEDIVTGFPEFAVYALPTKALP